MSAADNADSNQTYSPLLKMIADLRGLPEMTIMNRVGQSTRFPDVLYYTDEAIIETFFHLNYTEGNYEKNGITAGKSRKNYGSILIFKPPITYLF